MMVKSFLLAFLFVFTVSTQAAVLIEPVLGYNLGAKADFKSYEELGVTVSGEEYSGGTGPSYGGRLGYQNLGFQVGLDYLASSIDMDDKDFEDEVSTSEWAAFVGFRFPILLRVYAGYIFSATADTKTPDGLGGKVDAEFTGGSGGKAGIGWTLLPFLDLNLEYRRVSYDDWKFGTEKVKQEVDFSSWLLSVSLPFTF